MLRLFCLSFACGSLQFRLVFAAMQAAIESTGAQHARQIALFAEKGAASGVVTAETQGSDEGNRHHLHIAQAARRTIALAQRDEQIRVQAIHCYNRRIDEEVLEDWFGRRSFSTSSWTFKVAPRIT